MLDLRCIMKVVVFLMNRLQKVLISSFVLVVLVVAISLIASAILTPTQNSPVKNIIPSTDAQVNFPEGYTTAAWIWKYPTELDTKIDELIDFSNTEGINTLYVYIDEYIDIYELPDGTEKSTKMAAYISSIKNIISKAKSKNISVHALSGSPNYGYDSHDYIPPLIIEHVFEFNKQNPQTPFEGIQFDIEFYDDQRFFGSTEEYTQYYLDTVKKLAVQTDTLDKKYGQDLSLGFVIPFWFDKPNDYFSKAIFPELVENLSALQNSYLVVMAYRNVVEGDGGVMDIAKEELEETTGTPVKIIIAQEIVENKEVKITHFGKSRAEIKKDLNKIIELSNKYPNFKGVSIHELEAFTKTR